MKPLSQRASSLKPSGIRKFFDLIAASKDIISLGVPQGKQIGVILHELLEEVILDTLPNEHDVLLRKAVELIERT